MEQKKQIKKETIKRAVGAIRKFWKTGEVKYLHTRNNYCKSLANQVNGEAYFTKIDASTFCGVIDGIVEIERTLNKKTSYIDIYKIFELLGYEVE